jgi:GcrA cell cycle regulator
MSFWNEERLARLKELAGQGYSAGQIASLLGREFGGGVTRNAVVGKLLRGQGRYGSLQTLTRVPARVSRTGAATPPKAAPVRHSSASRAAGAPAGRRNDAGLRSKPRPAAVVPVNLPAPLPIGFFEAVETGRCLHFIGDPMGPGGPDMPVCGAERAQGAPAANRYCVRHLFSARPQPVMMTESPRCQGFTVPGRAVA